MKKLIALILALTLMMSLAACAKEAEVIPEETEPVTEAPTEPAKPVLHVVLPAAQEGWDGAAQQQAMSAVDAIMAEGKFEIVTENYDSVQQQAQVLEQIAAQSNGVDIQAVVTMPLGEELEETFAALLEANVDYALAGTILPGAEAASVTNVQYDQRAIGAAVAAWLVQNGLTQEDKVLIVQGLSEEEALRTEGFQLYLLGKAAHEGTVIEEPWTSTENIVYSDMQGETAQSAEDYFATYMEDADHAGLKYIAAWDDAYVLGILEALEGENIDSDHKAKFLEGAPFVAGCGGSQAMLDVLAGTSQYTHVTSLGGIQTVVISTDLLKLAVEVMAAYLDGTVVPQDNTQPIVWATAETAAQYQGYSTAQAVEAE